MKLLTSQVATRIVHLYLGKLKVAEIEEDCEVIPLKRIIEQCIIVLPTEERKYMYDELYSCLEIAKDTKEHAKHNKEELEADHRIDTLKRILMRLR